MDKLPSEKQIFNYSLLTNTKFLLFIAIIIIVMIYYLQKKIRKYLSTRKELKEMAEQYERKRECRNEYKFHFYWAIDRGENKSAIQIGNEIVELDKELKELYAQYQFYKSRGFYPLKKI